MSDDRSDIDARLSFIGMNEAKRSILREMGPLIAKVLPVVLDEFYVLVGKTSKDPQHMRHARDMQIKHWGLVATAEFGEAYLQSVRRIGETHSRLGLEPRCTSAAIASSSRESSGRSRPNCPPACSARRGGGKRPG
jgi:hypothetical protein